MSKLPQLSGRDCAKALGKVGFYLKRQEGSHMILRPDSPLAQLLPNWWFPIISSWTEAH